MDIVERLRCDAGEFFMRYGDTLLTEAADEIERLRTERNGRENQMINIRFERPLPQGYSRVPDDYDGPIYLESQMRWAVDQARKDALLEAADLLGDSHDSMTLRLMADEL